MAYYAGRYLFEEYYYIKPNKMLNSEQNIELKKRWKVIEKALTEKLVKSIQDADYINYDHHSIRKILKENACKISSRQAIEIIRFLNPLKLNTINESSDQAIIDYIYFCAKEYNGQ